MFEETAGS